MLEAVKSTIILTLLGLFIVTIVSKCDDRYYNQGVLDCRARAANQDKCGATR